MGRALDEGFVSWQDVVNWLEDAEETFGGSAEVYMSLVRSKQFGTMLHIMVNITPRAAPQFEGCRSSGFYVPNDKYRSVPAGILACIHNATNQLSDALDDAAGRLKGQTVRN